jgi:hypothetical protein
MAWGKKEGTHTTQLYDLTNSKGVSNKGENQKDEVALKDTKAIGLDIAECR